MKDSELGSVQLSGYSPGVIGKITELHAIYYHENWGFDISFETQVGRELSEFLNNSQEIEGGFVVATIDGEFAGSISIDGSRADTEGARLRWFIVSPGFQGRGIGGILIKHAMDFCRRTNYKKVYLWTFEGLDAARFLYEREGFLLCKAHDVYQWGQNIKEQLFEVNL